MEILLPRAQQCVSRVDAVIGPRVAPLAPNGKAAVVVLDTLQPLDIPLHRFEQLIGLGQALGIKGTQHIAQRRNGQNARGQLLRALERVSRKVKHGIGQSL